MFSDAEVMHTFAIASHRRQLLWMEIIFYKLNVLITSFMGCSHQRFIFPFDGVAEYSITIQLCYIIVNGVSHVLFDFSLHSSIIAVKSKITLCS